MIVGTHTCAPVLAALPADAMRLRKGRSRLFPGKHLVAIGLAGALPDLLNPHLALSARYSSWTHTLWFVLAIYPVFGMICRAWFRPRWILLSHCMWLATIAHLATDAISNGIRPLYPYGPVITYQIIPSSLLYWVSSDLVMITATVLLAVWVNRREGEDSSALDAGRRRLLNLSLVLVLAALVLLVLVPVVEQVRFALRADPAAKLIAAGLAPCNPRRDAAIDGAQDVKTLIEPIRRKFKLPCLAAVVLRDGKIVGEGVCGVRRAGGAEAAMPDDLFRLGTDTMVMTAMLMAALVEEGKLNWTTTVGEVFGSMKGMDAGWRPVTLQQLLMHRAGAPQSIDTARLVWRVWRAKGTPMQQRMGVVEAVVTRPPENTPGSKYLFSMVGYTIAGTMAEKVTGRPWEELIEEKAFRPLGIASAALGVPGERGKFHALQGHRQDGTPLDSGIEIELPPALGPARTVQMTMREWARFVMAHLRGDAGNPRRECSVIEAGSYDKLHSPVEEYAMGWSVVTNPWAKGSAPEAQGVVLAHSGGDMISYCRAWLAPERDFAMLIATNRGGDAAVKGVGELAGAILEKRRPGFWADSTTVRLWISAVVSSPKESPQAGRQKTAIGSRVTFSASGAWLTWAQPGAIHTLCRSHLALQKTSTRRTGGSGLPLWIPGAIGSMQWTRISVARKNSYMADISPNTVLGSMVWTRTPKLPGLS
jgi:CubicO group peptidase (beta-lactamase class C family)